MARALVALLLAFLPACGACDAYEPLDEPLPSLELTSLDGTPVELSAFRGRPLVLHLYLPS